MKKFLAVVKHEYRKIVLKWTFLVATLLFPIVAAAFAVIPALILSIKGDATRIVVVDGKGKIAPRIKSNLLREEKEEKIEQAEDEALKNLTGTQKQQIERTVKQMEEAFVFVEYNADAKSIEQIKRELNRKITDKELDAYLIVPPNYDAADASYEFFSRKSDDLISKSAMRNAINSAVRSQSLADANISESKLKEFGQSVDFSVKKISEEGDEKDSEGTAVGGVCRRVDDLHYFADLRSADYGGGHRRKGNAHRRNSFFVGETV